MANTRVEAEFIVDDKNSLKKLGKDADKASKSLGTMDRQTKGAAKASANATKNFSKMSQGITGGLVPAYATLAASLFAVSAAFNFLKEAGDFRVLKEGQEAYAAGTGIIMSRLAKRMQEVTDSQISFKDASQGAAIGISAGIQQKELIRLSKAAKDASAVLGRDVTDSFNRLIRGATKAEPELLDELGIILRLDDAKRNYALATGLSADKLTNFQRTQAVTNEILTQAEEKYGKILDILNPTTNQFNKLGNAFDNLINKVKTGLAIVAEPIAMFLSENILSATAAMGLFGTSIIKSMLPPIQQIKQQQKAFYQEQKEYLAKVKKAEKNRIANIEKYSKKEINIRKTNLREIQKISAAQGIILNPVQGKKGSMEFLAGSDSSNKSRGAFQTALTNAEKTLSKGLQIKSGIFEKYTEENIRQTRILFNEMKVASEDATKFVDSKWSRFWAKSEIAWAKFSTQATQAFSRVKVAIASVGTVLTGFMSLISWVGIGFLAWDLAKSFIMPITDAQKEVINLKDSLVDLSLELQKLGKVSVVLGRKGVEGGAFISNALGNIDEAELKKGLDLYNAGRLAKQRGNAFFGLFKKDEDKRHEEIYDSINRTFSSLDDLITFNSGYDFESGRRLLSLSKRFMESRGEKNYIPAIMEAFTQFKKDTEVAASYKSSAAQANEMSNRFFAEYIKPGQFDSSINAIEKQLSDYDKLSNITKIKDPAVWKEIAEARSKLKALQNFRTGDRAIETVSLRAQKEQVNSLIGKTNLQSRGQTLSNERYNNTIKQAEGYQRISVLQDMYDRTDDKYIKDAINFSISSEERKIKILEQQQLLLEKQANTLLEMGRNVTQVFENSLSKGINDFIMGTQKSFSDFATNMIMDIGKAISTYLSQELTLKFMDSFINPGNGGGVAGFFSSLLGGMVGSANGNVLRGGFQTFANGGVVNKPTLGLIGEGQYNEAVVPLPDGRAIPVVGAGGGGHVEVNINVSEGGVNTSTQGSQNLGNFGKAIGNMVREQMAKEMRPGGMLNR